jgi:hypothetical protein
MRCLKTSAPAVIGEQCRPIGSDALAKQPGGRLAVAIERDYLCEKACRLRSARFIRP